MPSLMHIKITYKSNMSVDTIVGDLCSSERLAPIAPRPAGSGQRPVSGLWVHCLYRLPLQPF